MSTLENENGYQRTNCSFTMQPKKKENEPITSVVEKLQTCCSDFGVVKNERIAIKYLLSAFSH